MTKLTVLEIHPKVSLAGKDLQAGMLDMLCSSTAVLRQTSIEWKQGVGSDTLMVHAPGDSEETSFVREALNNFGYEIISDEEREV